MLIQEGSQKVLLLPRPQRDKKARRASELLFCLLCHRVMLPVAEERKSAILAEGSLTTSSRVSQPAAVWWCASGCAVMSQTVL